MENAVDFASEHVIVTATWSDQDVVVMIEDDGPGFPPDVMDTLGEPYITTRPSGRAEGHGEGEASGLGLGFFIAKTLLERSGANLTLANRPDPARGALVRIVWTRATFESMDAALPAGSSYGPDGRVSGPKAALSGVAFLGIPAVMVLAPPGWPL